MDKGADYAKNEIQRLERMLSKVNYLLSPFKVSLFFLFMETAYKLFPVFLYISFFLLSNFLGINGLLSPLFEQFSSCMYYTGLAKALHYFYKIAFCFSFLQWRVYTSKLTSWEWKIA